LQAAIVKYGSVDLSDSARDTTAEVPLFGDSALAEVKQLMRSGYFDGLKYTNALSSRTDKTALIKFSELGISRKTDGTLTFSKSAFNRSAASDTTGLTPPADGDLYVDSAYAQPKLLDRFAAGTSSTLATSLTRAGSTITGTFDVRTAQYNNQLYTLRNKRTSESARIETERARLLKTYSQLNSLLANMSSTSNFLTAQLASLSKNNN
jgi:flagellar hook-associated protein 2